MTALVGAAIALLGFGPLGCERAGNEAMTQPADAETVVTVYTALDRQFSEPILDQFTKETGVKVQAVYDTESTKTVGLTNRIIAEANRPRCDVFWNNEILNTLRLKQAGVLQPCNPPEAAHYPPEFRDPDKLWYGFAARARVIIVNTERVPEAARPTSIRDLADPRWKGAAGIAKPLFGTTASHVACLFEALGPDAAKELLLGFKRNDIVITGGNRACAAMVASGQLALALTDTDDAIIEQEAGKPVAIVFSDQGADEIGTLLLPNTLSVIRGAPHPLAAEKLINYLLSAETEAKLAESASAQIPLHDQTAATSRVLRGAKPRPMKVDFAAAAAQFDAAARFIEQAFLE